MNYISTRGGGAQLSSSQAILKGIADDGGLYVPERIPHITDMPRGTYSSHAAWLLSQYFTDYEQTRLQEFASKAYSSDNFSAPEIAPLIYTPDVWFLELFHGKTLAFKDMALSLLPYLMTEAMKATGGGQTQVILTATSGDTGVSALEAFKNIDGIKVIVFYPEHGVSAVQKRHMMTQTGKNVFAIGVKGNFDDAQSEVKRIFMDNEAVKRLASVNHEFASANSINIGRLIPQIVYYFYAYSQLVSDGMLDGEAVSFIVPTGNFGNILAGYYAKKMGLPIHKLICACNENKTLYDFFSTGAFDLNRPLKLTISPSMDILLPSNLERLIFDLQQSPYDDSGDLGHYKFDVQVDDFVGYYATEPEIKEAIKRVYLRHNYLIDPHTAVGYVAHEKYKGQEKRVIISTASPFKFTKAVMTSFDPKYAAYDEFSLIESMAELKNEAVPPQIANLSERPLLHTTVVEIGEMKDTVLRILGM